jgi:hypothetical protein
MMRRFTGRSMRVSLARQLGKVAARG